VHLKDDLLEQHDLFKNHPEKLQMMHKKLREELGTQSFELVAPVTTARIRVLITEFQTDIPCEGLAIHESAPFKN